MGVGRECHTPGHFNPVQEQCWSVYIHYIYMCMCVCEPKWWSNGQNVKYNETLTCEDLYVFICQHSHCLNFQNLTYYTNIHTMKIIHPYNTAPQWPLELAHFGNTDHNDHRSSNDQTSTSQQISQGLYTICLHLCHNVKCPVWPRTTIFFWTCGSADSY